MTAPGAARRVLLGCYFTRSVALEGVGAVMVGLAEGMIQAGWQVTLLVPDGGGDFPAAARVETYNPSLPLGPWQYRRRIAELSSNVDAVLLTENNPNAAGAAKSSRCENTLCMFYTPLQTLAVLWELGPCRQGFVHAIGKSYRLCRLRRLADLRCIVASDYQAEQLRSLGAKEIHVLPVCSLSRSAELPSRSAARAELGWDDRPVVGYLGHFSPAKGVETLVEAFADCSGPPVLALAHSGKGRLRRRAGETLEALRRSGRARMAGVVAPCTFLAACDVVALPFRTSSVFHQPQVMLESFAAATAVITTDVGGCGELIGRQGAGELVAPRDSQALAAAINRRLADLPGTHEMGLAARRLFEQRLCREAFCGRLTELFGGPPA